MQSLAGSDTTAISLRSVFYHVLKSPTVLAKLREELETAERSGEISESVTLAEGLKLPYLYVKLASFLDNSYKHKLRIPRKGKLSSRKQ